MKKSNKKILSEKQVLHIAKLANLELTSKEVLKFQSQLSEILNYIKVLKRVGTNNIKPTSQVTGLKNVFREDKIISSLTQKYALENSKKKTKDYFKVKAIF